MSNKKEAERANIEDETRREVRTELQEQNHAVDKTLDGTRDSIRRTLDEARREIPRNTQAVNDYQEHNLQAAKEITDSYIESQKQIIRSFQSVWAPIIQNTYDTFWNRWASPRGAAEVYARTVSNFADNVVMTTKIANNSVTANMEVFRTFIQREKEDAKEFSRIATNTAKTFENTSRELTTN